MDEIDGSNRRFVQRNRTFLASVLVGVGVLVISISVLRPTNTQGAAARVEELRWADRKTAEAIIADLAKLSRPGLAKLAQFIKDDNPNVQRGVAIALANAASLNVETAKELQPGLHDSAVSVREYCARAIGKSEWKGPEVAALMAKLFVDPSLDVRNAAVLALGEQGESARPYVPLLNEKMCDEWWGCGKAAAAACRKLGKVAAGAERGLGQLINLRSGLYDPDEAIEALAALQTPEALNELIDEVRDHLGPPGSRNADRAEHACRAIAKFGSEGRPAMWILKRAYLAGKDSAASDLNYDSGYGAAAREAILAVDPAEAKAIGIKPKQE